MLISPVAAGAGIVQVTGFFLFAQVLKTEHGIVPVGVYHDPVVSHFVCLIDPSLPVRQVPARAAAQEVVPVKNKPFFGQRFILHFPTRKAIPFCTDRACVTGYVETTSQLFKQCIDCIQ